MNELEKFKELLKKDMPIKEQVRLFKKVFGLERNTFFRWKYNLKHNKPLHTAKHTYHKDKSNYDLCYFCNKRNNLNTHHIDGNRNNDSKTNLVVLCASCHHRLHLLISKI